MGNKIRQVFLLQPRIMSIKYTEQITLCDIKTVTLPKKISGITNQKNPGMKLLSEKAIVMILKFLGTI